MDEIFADLEEFRLPLRVVQVASIVCGCLLLGIRQGLPAAQREQLLKQRLCEHGCGAYLPQQPPTR